MRFTVVVPVYEHWKQVPLLLDRLRRQNFPARDFEVILVDNGSQGGPPPVLLPENVCVIRCLKPGSYAARNRGARNAQGEWLVFTDADCLPTPQWLDALDEAAGKTRGASLLAGRVDMVSGAVRPNIYEIYDMVRGIPQERYISRGYAATANLAVPKSVFDEVGGFDEERFSGGDAEFCRRAGMRGYSIVYIPQARVDHPSRHTWQQIATKERRIKGGQLAAGAARRRRVQWLRTFAPPVFGVWRFLRAASHPLQYRLIAVSVLFRVWLLGIMEALRLGMGGQPERR